MSGAGVPWIYTVFVGCRNAAVSDSCGARSGSGADGRHSCDDAAVLRAPWLLGCVALATGACVDAPRPIGVARQPSGVLAESRPAKVDEGGENKAPTEPPTPLVPFDSAGVHLLLDDPRLLEAKTFSLAAKNLEAGRSVARALDQAEAPERAKWSYLEGRLRLAGGDPKGAASAFDRAGAVDGPLRSFALLASAEALAALGDHAGAVERALRVDRDLVPSARLEPLLARSLVRSGKLEEGFERFRVAMRDHPRGWPKLALELARALLAHPASGRGLEAAKLATEVDLDAPSGRFADEAKKTLASATATLGREEREALASSISVAERGRRLSASGQSKRAVALLDRLAKKGVLGCADSIARAEALTGVKRHSEASAEYGRAIESCPTEAPARDLAVVLFAAGRAAARGGMLQVARERFKRIEDSFATHRLADDARLEGARAALEDGDEQAFDAMLSTIADDYPSGDMRGDGLFVLGIAYASRGDWAHALSVFARAALLPPERAYERAGRFAYYRGRALLMTGHADEGRAELVRVLREAPCGFYMALAYGRLESLEKGAGKTALREAAARAKPLTDGVPPDVFASPSWRTAVALVEVDDPVAAASALARLGVTDRTARPETLWASARLLARATDPVPAHAVLRTAFEVEPRVGKNELYEFRMAYPSAGAARAPWEIAYPRPFARAVTDAASESGTPEALLFAVMREESAFDPEALSKASAVGLLQLLPVTAQKMARALRVPYDDGALVDPAKNIRFGAKYLAQMRKHFADDPLLAIPGYNAGGGAPERWTRDEPSRDFDLFVESIPYAETRAYTKRVISSLCAYELLYGDPDTSEALGAPLVVRPSEP